MKWKIEKGPEVGEYRISRKFAYIPIEIGEYEVWLEYYYIRQIYTRRFTDYNFEYFWSDERYSNKGEYTNYLNYLAKTKD